MFYFALPPTCAQKRLVHARNDYSLFHRNTCKQCYSLRVRKRRSINTPGWFRFHVQGGQWAMPFTLLVLHWLYQQSSLNQAFVFSLLSVRISLNATVWLKKNLVHMCERKRNLLYSPGVILSKNKTNCRCLATTHPAGQTSRLSFIQRRPPLCDSHSKRHTYTHAHTFSCLAERGIGSCIIHPWKHLQQPAPERTHADCKSTCRYYEISLTMI